MLDSAPPEAAGSLDKLCSGTPYADFLQGLSEHYRTCLDGQPNGTCLPTRVSNPLVAQAGDLIESHSASSSAPWDWGLSCPRGFLAALAVWARPLVHTPRGQWAAQTAFEFASRECWPTVGFQGGDWPVTYNDILEVVLDAEAWQEFGPEAEYQRPPRWPMPVPFLHELTPVASQHDVIRHSRFGHNHGPSPLSRRRVHVLSTGNHASYPAAIFSVWRALLHTYDFELEDHSFDTRYCGIAGSCSADNRFAWLGEHLRGTIIETCGGLFLKGFEDIDALAERFTELIVAGDESVSAARADVLLCTHPPYSCRLFWPLVLRHGKPLLGFFGGTLEAHVPATGMRAWLSDFREMAQHSRVQLTAIAPFLAEKMRYQTGVDIPAVRGFGFHVMARNVTYLPTRLHEVLVWKNSDHCEDNQDAFDALLADLARKVASAGGSTGETHSLPALRFHHLRRLRRENGAPYSVIASFRAVVFMPYEVLLMTFYELYHVAIPLFLPALELGCFFMYRGPVTYPHCDLVLDERAEGAGPGDPRRAGGAVAKERGAAARGQAGGAPGTELPGQRPRAPYSPFARARATDRLAWLEAYTDWYRFPHLQRFSSLAELVTGLHSADLQAVSAAMRQETESALVGAADFWGRAFAKVLGDS